MKEDSKGQQRVNIRPAAFNYNNKFIYKRVKTINWPLDYNFSIPLTEYYEPIILKNTSILHWPAFKLPWNFQFLKQFWDAKAF